jgi:hypothetical protein
LKGHDFNHGGELPQVKKNPHDLQIISPLRRTIEPTNKSQRTTATPETAARDLQRPKRRPKSFAMKILILNPFAIRILRSPPSGKGLKNQEFT